MKTFQVCVVWKMTKVVSVKAETLEDAKDEALTDDTLFDPKTDGALVEDSFECDDDETDQLNDDLVDEGDVESDDSED